MQTAPTRAGHPPGLYVLFFTELWERYSFYSMMAILTLYMDEALHFSTTQIGAVYGGYIGGVYFMPLIGGFLADRVLGFNRAVIVGGVLMMIGHLVLARRIAPLLLHGARAARLRRRLHQAERLDHRRQPLSRPPGAARRGLQPLLHGDQHRRVHLAADGRLVPRALRLERGVRIGRRRDVPVAAGLHRLQPARGRRGADGRGEVGRGDVGRPRAGARRASSRCSSSSSSRRSSGSPSTRTASRSPSGRATTRSRTSRPRASSRSSRSASSSSRARSSRSGRGSPSAATSRRRR